MAKPAMSPLMCAVILNHALTLEAHALRHLMGLQSVIVPKVGIRGIKTIPFRPPRIKLHNDGDGQCLIMAEYQQLQVFSIHTQIE